MLVIGAGLAGCALAESFSRRSCQVLVLEARPHVGGAVAGLPLIAQHPALTPDFDLRSQLLIRAMQWHDELRAGTATDLQCAFEVCGRWQPMATERAMRCTAHVPPSVAVVASRASMTQAPDRSDTTIEHPPSASTASTRNDRAPVHEGTTADGAVFEPGLVTMDCEKGIFFPRCAALSPLRWWQQVLKRPGVELRLGEKVARIEAISSPSPLSSNLRTSPAVPGSGGIAAPAPRQATADHDHGAPAAENLGHTRPGRQIWRAFDANGLLLAEADVLVLACRDQAFGLAGMGEDEHGRLRLSAARVWTARADGGPANEDPGSPALMQMTGGQGLALTRPGRFWLRSEEHHRQWLQTGVRDEDMLRSLEADVCGSTAAIRGPARFGGYGRGAAPMSNSLSDTVMERDGGSTPASTRPVESATERVEGRHPDDRLHLEALCEFLSRPECWHPSPIGERMQLRDNLPMIGAAPDLDRIRIDAERLARNDRLPMPRRAGLYLLTGLAGRGALYAPIGAEMIAAEACGEEPPVDARLVRAVDPCRFIKRRLQRAWSRR